MFGRTNLALNPIRLMLWLRGDWSLVSLSSLVCGLLFFGWYRSTFFWTAPRRRILSTSGLLESSYRPLFVRSGLLKLVYLVIPKTVLRFPTLFWTDPYTIQEHTSWRKTKVKEDYVEIDLPSLLQHIECILQSFSRRFVWIAAHISHTSCGQSWITQRSLCTKNVVA